MPYLRSFFSCAIVPAPSPLRLEPAYQPGSRMGTSTRGGRISISDAIDTTSKLAAKYEHRLGVGPTVKLYTVPNSIGYTTSKVSAGPPPGREIGARTPRIHAPNRLENRKRTKIASQPLRPPYSQVAPRPVHPHANAACTLPQTVSQATIPAPNDDSIVKPTNKPSDASERECHEHVDMSLPRG